MTPRLSLLFLVFASSAARAGVFPVGPHVYVEGSAEIRIEPDTVQITVAIEATDPQLAAAKATVDDRARKLIDACKRLGVEDRDITSASLQMRPHYEYRREERKFLGTSVYREIDVTLRDLGHYSELIKSFVSAQVGEITSTTLSSSNGAGILEQAQQQALADARARAERLAAASGQALGAAYSVSEFDQRQQERYRLYPARAIGARRAGLQSFGEANVAALGASPAEEPFEPGTIAANATVYVIFLLEPKRR
jgi:uncharacterized protein YggE